jgi:hypothetical protein
MPNGGHRPDVSVEAGIKMVQNGYVVTKRKDYEKNDTLVFYDLTAALANIKAWLEAEDFIKKSNLGS